MKKMMAILVAVFMMSGLSSCILVDPNYRNRHPRDRDTHQGGGDHHDRDRHDDRDGRRY